MSPTVDKPSGCYAACHHDQESPIDVDQNGMLTLNSSLSLQDVEDGQQYTLLVAELRNQGHWAVGTRLSLRNTGVTIDTISSPPPATGAVPAASTGMTDEIRLSQNTAVGGFGSYHNGGMSILTVDGSIRFININVDSGIYRHLGNRRDHQIIGEF